MRFIRWGCDIDGDLTLRFFIWNFTFYKCNTPIISFVWNSTFCEFEQPKKVWLNIKKVIASDVSYNSLDLCFDDQVLLNIAHDMYNSALLDYSQHSTLSISILYDNLDVDTYWSQLSTTDMEKITKFFCAIINDRKDAKHRVEHSLGDTYKVVSDV